MLPNPQETADLVIFIDKIFNGKLQFLCSDRQEIWQRIRTTIAGSTNSVYEQYSQDNHKCTVNYWKLTLDMVLKLSNRSPWSGITEKEIDFLIVRTPQKIKFLIRDFFSKCEQIHSLLGIRSHLLNISLMENFNFCAVRCYRQQVCTYLTFHDGGRYHIETSPLICGVNPWTGFYMISASVMKGLKLP